VRYELDVDEVVLHGFAHVDRRRISSAFAHELGLLVGRDGPRPGAIDRDRVRGRDLEVSSFESSALGRGLAHTVHRAVRG